MNKMLIVLSIAAALTAPLAAQAGVEVYGEARPSLDFVNNNDNAPGNEDSTFSLSSNYSHLGFKGDEDLGNGLSAMWQIEQEVHFDTGAAFSTARDTFVGLGGGFGSVMAGHMRTPYRTATNQLDPFRDTRADYNAIIGSVDGSGIFNDESRTSNTIAYTTPNMSGFSASVAYMLSDVTGTDDLVNRTSASKDRDAYSLSASYNNGPIFVTGGYESLNNSGLSGDDATAWKIGGSYTIMNATTFGAVYDNADVGGAVGDRSAWYLSAAHKMGDTTLMAAYGAADDTSTNNTGANQFSLGVSQALSKNTDVYALYTMVGNDSAGAYSLDNTPGVVAGEDMSAFSVVSTTSSRRSNRASSVNKRGRLRAPSFFGSLLTS